MKILINLIHVVMVIQTLFGCIENRGGEEIGTKPNSKKLVSVDHIIIIGFTRSQFKSSWEHNKHKNI